MTVDITATPAADSEQQRPDRTRRVPLSVMVVAALTLVAVPDSWDELHPSPNAGDEAQLGMGELR